MTERCSKPFVPPWKWLLSFALGYFASAIVAAAFRFPPAPLACYWLPAGLYLGVLLRCPSHSWPWFVLAAFPANLAFDLLSGRGPATSLLLFAGCSGATLAAAWLVRRWVTDRPTLANVHEVVTVFLVAALVDSTLSATICSATLSLTAPLVSGGTDGPSGAPGIWRESSFSRRSC